MEEQWGEDLELAMRCEFANAMLLDAAPDHPIAAKLDAPSIAGTLLGAEADSWRMNRHMLRARWKTVKRSGPIGRGTWEAEARLLDIFTTALAPSLVLAGDLPSRVVDEIRAVCRRRMLTKLRLALPRYEIIDQRLTYYTDAVALDPTRTPLSVGVRFGELVRELDDKGSEVTHLKPLIADGM